MTAFDETHDASATSWVASANGHPDFPIQNLPHGVFSTRDNPVPRGGIAIGDQVLDLGAALDAGLFDGEAAHAAGHGAASTLNGLMAAGAGSRVALRRRLFAMLSEGSPDRSAAESLLVPSSACTMHMPAAIGDYTDFYAGIHHATNVGRLFRPDEPLLPNYKHVPIGYHGRSSSIVVSGAPLRRPNGQRKGPGDASPTFGPSRRLDFELELGLWVGPGNDLGAPIAIGDAEAHIAGLCLLNDWSARDLQAWEYQPLGPFLAKNFATSVSAWVVTPEALAPFRIAQPPRPDGDPSPLPYLLDSRDQAHGGFDLELEVLLRTPCLDARGLPPHRLSMGSARYLYWTAAQLVTHHTSNGCNLRSGDLLGTGTISTPTPDGLGSLLEITEGGRVPLTLASGNTRTFLEDGDEVIMRARGRRGGYQTVGFGELRGVVMPAVASGVSSRAGS